jgi:hypothetical protein
MKGEGDVVTGWQNKLQSAIANVTPAGMLAEQHRNQGPQEGQEGPQEEIAEERADNPSVESRSQAAVRFACARLSCALLCLRDTPTIRPFWSAASPPIEPAEL